MGMANQMPGTGMFVVADMAVPNVGLNEAANWGGSSMRPLTILPILPGLAVSAQGVGVTNVSAQVSGTQGSIEIQLLLGALVVNAAASGSIAAVAGSRLVDEAATGSITTVAGADLVDGQTFTLNDGVNAAKVFEFDSNASVAAGHVAVAFTAADSPSTVRNTIITAVNGAASLDITASIGGTDKVILVNDKGGAFGNQAITESVLDNGFLVSGMSGGGETFTLNDGVHPAKTFEFDSDGTATSTSVGVAFTAGDSATTVRNSIVSAINGASNLDITASPSGANLVLLANDTAGAFGNQPISETVADSGFIVSGMAQGTTATSVRTVCYLTDNPTNPLHYLAIRVDATNRPYVEITDQLGVVVALVTPSYADLDAGQPVTIRVAWDSQNVIDSTSGRHVTLKVNNTLITGADWTTNPTTSWAAFKPTTLVVGASLGDADFDGTISLVQVSNVATP